uniref:Uncharacterized protein n=1 Tax=Chlorobium chlorochromatii (strain CaD3) TaxID=340177 RepID=Q3AQ66_CHLCH
MALRKNIGESYTPTYFLASLGNGGLAVTFFMFLMFMIPHKGRPMPVFEDIVAALQSTLPIQFLTIVSLVGIIWFSAQHYRMLIWNIRQYLAFKHTPAFNRFQTTDAQVQLMAIPLTYAMAINVMFILGAVFVPQLWSVVEYLFPMAMGAFFIVGIYSISIFYTFFSRVIAHGGFDCEKNNSLSQMLSIFTFSMVAVGFAAPGAMSHNVIVSGVGIIMATFFLALVTTLGVIKIVLGFRSMLAHGINYEASVSLWIVIPILTLVGITIYRIAMGLVHNFDAVIHPWAHVIMFTALCGIQIFFGLLGYGVMKELGYFNEFIHGESKSAVSFAAICPGVAFVVLGNFFINRGLVAAGLIEMFSVAYFVLYIPLLAIQAQTIIVLMRLTRKLLKA